MKVSNSWIHDGYRVLVIDGVSKKYAHYVWWQNTGHWPQHNDGEIIHHINGDKLDDEFENLQLMTQSEHKSLHNRIWFENHSSYWLGKTNPEHSKRMMGEKNPMFGKSRPDMSECMIEWHRVHDITGENNPCFGRIGELNPQYNKTGSFSPKWIRGEVCYKTQKSRLYRARKRIAEGRGDLTDLLLIQQNE